MKNSIIQAKTYRFSIRIIHFYKHLTEKNREFILSKQILRSGTSIGANVEEALGGQSRKDFLAKLSISYKEARETCYWLRLLTDTKFVDEADALRSLLSDCDEILRIIGSIQKTMKKNSNSQLVIRNS